MKERYVVDTNVLIAASAVAPIPPRNIDATPQDFEWQKKVWEWLDEFSQSDSRMVLDDELKIYDEYKNSRHLSFQDFGTQVVIHKMSTCAVDTVPVEFDADGNGVLPERLAAVVIDLADRKMAAAALASHDHFGEGCVAFAGDTDWHDWEHALAEHQVLLEPIIEAWSRQKHAEKQQR